MVASDKARRSWLASGETFSLSVLGLVSLAATLVVVAGIVEADDEPGSDTSTMSLFRLGRVSGEDIDDGEVGVDVCIAGESETISDVA